MISDVELERHRRAQTEIRRRAKNELGAWFAVQDTWDARAFRESLTEFMAYLTGKYGDLAASVAADFYDEMRAAAPVTAGAFRAVAHGGVSLDEVARGAAWAVGPLFASDQNREQALGMAGAVIGRFVKNTAARTISDSARRDPAGPTIVRVPRGASTCAFCIMLASRGYLDGGYTSRASASRVGASRRGRAAQATTGRDDSYHDDCDCETVTIYPGEEPPASWRFEEYARMYEAGAAGAGTRSDTSKVLAAMRDLHGLH